MIVGLFLVTGLWILGVNVSHYYHDEGSADHQGE